MKYIAYGSNMVEEQMARRCPNARLIGMGQLPNHRLEFYLHATVERSRAHGANVSISEEVINAIHSYFVDMGVRIEDTTQGLYYHVPD